ncbi:MAG: serine/threonine-protein kinase [Cyanobacteriota bacterium]|nr:serine/threonine-protein kinase [Cyanobacteriota bacterium]
MSYCFNPACHEPQNQRDANYCENCGSQLLLTPNSTLGIKSRYRAIKPIGEGGFGRTFLAVDEENSLKQECVIKQFFPQGSTYSAVMPLATNSISGGREIEESESKGRAIARKAAELFEAEAMQLEMLGSHPQIPKFIGHFQQEGDRYLVQEYIEGKNLDRELAEKGPFNETQIWELLNDLLPVLEFIHKSKIIHRDIKPENIIRRQLPPGSTDLENPAEMKNAQLVLVDFGAAKVVENTGLPKKGTVIGSAAYTAPEQLMGKAVFASDIYSLGVTCIHLLTEVPPFDLFDSRENKWVWRHYLKVPVSDKLGLILDKMLAGATGRRFHSAGAILRLLNPQKSQYESSLHFSEKTVSNSIKKTQSLVLANTGIISGKPEVNIYAKIRAELQKALDCYGVNVRVSKGKKQLTIIISRKQKESIPRAELCQIVGRKLTELQLKNVEKVKLVVKVKGKKIPEWQQVLKIDKKTRLKNQINRLKKHEKAAKLSKLTTKYFWLAKSKEIDFWRDSLMFALVWFIFAYQAVVWHPVLSVPIASAFIWVKHQVSRDKIFASNKLLANLAVLFFILGILDARILTSGLFGLLCACVFVALPMFYVRESSDDLE